MGTSFLLLENVKFKWNKCKGAFQTELVSNTVQPGNALFMYSGGCVPEDGGYGINGWGTRNSNCNEAYYYALMHAGQSFKKPDCK